MRMLYLLVAGALMAILLASVSASEAVAQPQSASSAWNDAYRRGANERLVALEYAIAQQRARDGGYGAAYSTTNIAGDYNVDQTYNGPVSNSTAYNCGQCITIDNEINGDGNTIGNDADQTADDIDQDSDADVFIGRIVVLPKCGSAGQC